MYTNQIQSFKFGFIWNFCTNDFPFVSISVRSFTLIFYVHLLGVPLTTGKSMKVYQKNIGTDIKLLKCINKIIVNRLFIAIKNCNTMKDSLVIFLQVRKQNLTKCLFYFCCSLTKNETFHDVFSFKSVSTLQCLKHWICSRIILVSNDSRIVPLHFHFLIY